MKSWKVEIGIRNTETMEEEIKATHLIGKMGIAKAKEKANEIGLEHSVIGEYLAKHPNPGRYSFYRWEQWDHDGELTRWGKYVSEIKTDKDWRLWYLQFVEVG